MSEIINDFCKEATLLEFESRTCIAIEREYAANVYDMFFRDFQK